jgi:formate C-acetyltransferase
MKQALDVHFVGAAETWTEGTKGCIERARYLTETMKQTEGEPYVIRRAKALANYLAKKTLFITDDEVIVGHLGKDIDSIPFYVEVFPYDILRPGPEGMGCLREDALTTEEWKELEEICQYWKGKTLEEVSVREIPEEIKDKVYPPESAKTVYAYWYRHSVDNVNEEWSKLFRTGWGGIRKEIVDRLAKLDLFHGPQDKFREIRDQKNELTAMLIGVDAMINYCGRYSALALDMAKKEKNPTRKKELEQIAKNCNIVEPAKSFYQCLQWMWLEHMVSRNFESMAGGIPGRWDQLLIAFYRNDLKAGILTREKAQDLLEEMWLKYERGMANLHPWSSRAGAHGTSMLFQSITLGGVDKYGRDACNELTYLIMDTCKSIQTTQPTLSFRYHPGTPDEALVKCWEVIKTGLGMPAMYNDAQAIPYLMSRWGASLEDARENIVMGCIAEQINEKNNGSHVRRNGVLNIAKCFELALNDGIDPLDGKELGPRTGDPKKFHTYEDLFEAFRKQVGYAMDLGICCSDIASIHHEEILTRPISSPTSSHAIEVGKDAGSKNEYDAPFFVIPAVVDAVDSLAATKKLVYEEKKVSMDKMLKALAANFEGYEDVLKLCLEVPKFGEDEDYVDLIARDVFHMINQEAWSKKDYRGSRHNCQFHGAGIFEPCGMMVKALPSGRKAHEPCADGGVSPVLGHGKDITKVLRSAAKIDHMEQERMLLNSRLSPSTTPKQFINLIRSWADMGLSHIQFNVFDTKTLRAAQATPEKYPDLVVRVAGYSAQFIALVPPTQEAIIRRAEQVVPSTMC